MLPHLWPSCRQQGVATSALCECGSGSPRMRDQRGPFFPRLAARIYLREGRAGCTHRISYLSEGRAGCTHRYHTQQDSSLLWPYGKLFLLRALQWNLCYG
jgi:hypothetical protein